MSGQPLVTKINYILNNASILNASLIKVDQFNSLIIEKSQKVYRCHSINTSLTKVFQFGSPNLMKFLYPVNFFKEKKISRYNILCKHMHILCFYKFNPNMWVLITTMMHTLNHDYPTFAVDKVLL